MTRDQILAIQREIGTTPDGVWGPLSSAACKQYLLCKMPSPNPWPSPDDAAMRAFYGEPGDEGNLELVRVPENAPIEFEGVKVKFIRCHKKVAASLSRILGELGKHYPEICKQFAGCYVNRKMRNSWRTSKHAWGVAIDFAAETNGLNTPWPKDATMPLGVMEIFAREGWTSGGAFWGRDAMHAEATKP